MTKVLLSILMRGSNVDSRRRRFGWLRPSADPEEPGGEDYGGQNCGIQEDDRACGERGKAVRGGQPTHDDLRHLEPPSAASDKVRMADPNRANSVLPREDKAVAKSLNFLTAR